MTEPDFMLKPVGFFVCMPTRGSVSIETLLCLRENLDGYPHKLLTAIRMPVVEARNQLAKEARELDPNTLDFDPRYVLWTDDDAWWCPGTVDRAVQVLESNPEVSIVVGMQGQRCPYQRSHHRSLDGIFLLPAECKPGELVSVDRGSLHFGLMRRSILQTVGDEPFNRRLVENPCPVRVFGDSCETYQPEDHSFFGRVIEAGGKIVCDPSLRIGHVEVANGKVYFVGEPAHDARGLDMPTPSSEPYAIGNARKYFTEDAISEVWRPDAQETALNAEQLARSNTTRNSEVLKFLGHAIDALPPGHPHLKDLALTYQAVTGETPSETIERRRKAESQTVASLQKVADRALTRRSVLKQRFEIMTELDPRYQKAKDTT